MTVSMADVYQHDPNIVSRNIAGEVILVPIRKNVSEMESIYTLNETAARVWELIDGKNSLDQALSVILEEFDIAAQDAKADLFELVDGLIAIGALVKG